MSKKKLDYNTKSKSSTNRNSISFRTDHEFQRSPSPSQKHDSAILKGLSKKNESSNQINMPMSDYYQSYRSNESGSILKRSSIGKSSYLSSYTINNSDLSKSNYTSQTASVITIPPMIPDPSPSKDKSSTTNMKSSITMSNNPRITNTGYSSYEIPSLISEPEKSVRPDTPVKKKSSSGVSSKQSGSTIPSVFRSPHRHVKHSPTRASSFESPSSISSCNIQEKSDIFVSNLSSSSTKTALKHQKKMRSSSTMSKRAIDQDTVEESQDDLTIPKENVVRWFQHLPTKNQFFESPVDIDINAMERLSLPPLSWHSFDTEPRKLKLTNTGHTLILSGKWFYDRPSVMGGPLTSEYIFSQLHFHWGCDENEGSEHTVDGQQYPLEMHVVTYKSDYGSQEQALKEDDGMCTIAYFFTLQKNANPSIQGLINSIHEVKRSQSASHIDPFPLSNFIKPFPNDYFLYWGSVSTNDCKHLLLWIVCREPIGISPDQIYSFRTMLDQYNEPLLRNFRPVDPRQKPRVFHVNPRRFSSLHYTADSAAPNKSQYRVHQCTTGSHEHVIE